MLNMLLRLGGVISFDEFINTPIDYTPPWISGFSVGEQDQYGWTVIEPELDSRFAYVSSDGNDATAQVYDFSNNDFLDYFNPSSENAFATIEAAALACYRTGKSDFVCVRTGDEIVFNNGFRPPLGNSNRHHITTYGSSSVRPTVDIRDYTTNACFIDSFLGNLAITNIHFTCTERNPNHENFAGWMLLSSKPAGFLFSYNGNSEVRRGLLVENCKIDYLNIGFMFSGGNASGGGHEDIIIRRNLISYIFGGFSIGINSNWTKQLIEENTFYKCGYYDEYVDVETDFSYEGHIEGTSLTTLSGSDVMTIELSKNLPVNTPLGTKVEITTNSDSVVSVPILAFNSNLITIPATNFSEDNVDSGNLVVVYVYGATPYYHSVYISQGRDSIVRRNTSIKPSSIHFKHTSDQVNTVNSKNVSIYDNLTIGGEVVLSAGGNVNSNTSARFKNFDFVHNVSVHLGLSNPTDRGVGWGYEYIDQEDSKLRRNILILPASSATNKKSLDMNSILKNVEATDNIMSNAGGVTINPENSSQIYTIDKIVDSSFDSSFVNVNVGIDAFMNDPDLLSAVESFTENMLNRNKSNWIKHDENYKKFVRDGFTTINGKPLITRQPANREADFGGGFVTFHMDSYSPYDKTLQWYYSDGTPISGETNKTLTLFVDENNSGVMVYCRVSTEHGEINTNVVSATVASRRYQTISAGESLSLTVPELNVDSYNESVTYGQGMRFKFRTNVQSSSFFSSFGNSNFVFKENFSIFQMRIGAPFYPCDISNININDGVFHEITYIQTKVGQAIGISVDGDFYTSGINSPLYIPQDMRTFTGDNDGDYQICDIEYFSIDEETGETTQLAFYAVDDFLTDGETANATVGAGTITYNVNGDV